MTFANFSFAELFTARGLARLDEYFLSELQKENATLYSQLIAYRKNENSLSSIEKSEFLIQTAIVLENFLARFFDIEEEVAQSQIKTTSYNPISVFKKYFVLRRAKKELHRLETLPSFQVLNDWLLSMLEKAPIKSSDPELSVALLGVGLLETPEKEKENIEKLVQWCTHCLVTSEAQEIVSDWASFHLPERIDYQALVPTEAKIFADCERKQAPGDTWRLRDGFKLTDERMNAKEVQDEVNYCIYCHDHEGDFCSKGFPVKKGDPEQGFKKNPLDITLTGCPLDEKISEMQWLKSKGHTIASLAMVMIDNPMCPATGHRICNDCMKACIYQKQDPVNIPQIETRVLTDTLDLPWGVEIYDLLTRWHPLRQQQWRMKPYNGLKVMIAGMGPAGFTLAHHLLLEGFAVVGFDGLKIEPLNPKLIHEPVRDFNTLKESLDERLMAGFGGVAEYGITVRWDKNFLKLIYLSLKRKPFFQVFGGVRFGGTVTIEEAWSMGFDHFVVAVGAGLPKALPIPHSMAPGMRQANDFLMALQLGNAAKKSSLSNLQVRLPAVVIGGGLTGVDTATELQAYYIVQVERLLTRYEIMREKHGDDFIMQQLDIPSKQILKEFLEHGLAVRREREAALEEKRLPDFIKLIHAWGGVTIAYRKTMQESPAYINNHEELQKAFQEGIYYIENIEPQTVQLDEYGHSKSIIFKKRDTDETIELPARAILVATGTQPNTAYEFEHRGTFLRVNLQYQHFEDKDGELVVAHGVKDCKDAQFGPFTSYHQNHHRVSLIGDTHPIFHGNVVKAIASGMRTYPKILALFKDKLSEPGNADEYTQFAQSMDTWFTTYLKEIKTHRHDMIELIVHAPLAAKRYKPGEFYRLQNYETYAPTIQHTLLQMEPFVARVAKCDKHANTLHFMMSKNTVSGKIASMLTPHQPISLMGPTGVRAKIPSTHETILMIGNRDSLPFVLSVGSALKQAGNTVIFLARAASTNELYDEAALTHATTRVITNDSPDIVETLLHYTQEIPLADIDCIYLLGDADLLRQFQHARKTKLKPLLMKDPKVIGAVYGNMQCMLKGVCAQCLQWQIDPETGLRTKAVFACSWQDQPLELIDIEHMKERAEQNHLQEVFNRLWVENILIKSIS